MASIIQAPTTMNFPLDPLIEASKKATTAVRPHPNSPPNRQPNSGAFGLLAFGSLAVGLLAGWDGETCVNAPQFGHSVDPSSRSLPQLWQVAMAPPL